MAPWESLIRFSATEGGVYWAALPLNEQPKSGIVVKGYETVESLEESGPAREVTVGELLAPVPVTGIPIICVGLNYKNHANEASLPIPKDPPMWYKPAAALANPNTTIPFPQQAHTNFPDFEGELAIVLRDAIRSLSPAEARAHILGYTIGNDLTARMFQRSAGQGQYTYAKGFDKFAPLGPRLVHPDVFSPETAKGISTKINGKIVQDSPFDFIFGVGDLLSFLCQGTTLPSGTAIMTGTPSGVGWFQNPKCELKDGDVVEIEVAPIGVLKNTIKFDNE